MDNLNAREAPPSYATGSDAERKLRAEQIESLIRDDIAPQDPELHLDGNGNKYTLKHLANRNTAKLVRCHHIVFPNPDQEDEKNAQMSLSHLLFQIPDPDTKGNIRFENYLLRIAYPRTQEALSEVQSRIQAEFNALKFVRSIVNSDSKFKIPIPTPLVFKPLDPITPSDGDNPRYRTYLLMRIESDSSRIGSIGGLGSLGPDTKDLFPSLFNSNNWERFLESPVLKKKLYRLIENLALYQFTLFNKTCTPLAGTESDSWPVESLWKWYQDRLSAIDLKPLLRQRREELRRSGDLQVPQATQHLNRGSAGPSPEPPALVNDLESDDDDASISSRSSPSRQGFNVHQDALMQRELGDEPGVEGLQGAGPVVFSMEETIYRGQAHDSPTDSEISDSEESDFASLDEEDTEDLKFKTLETLKSALKQLKIIAKEALGWEQERTFGTGPKFAETFLQFGTGLNEDGVLIDEHDNIVAIVDWWGSGRVPAWRLGMLPKMLRGPMVHKGILARGSGEGCDTSTGYGKGDNLRYRLRKVYNKQMKELFKGAGRMEDWFLYWGQTEENFRRGGSGSTYNGWGALDVHVWENMLARDFDFLLKAFEGFNNPGGYLSWGLNNISDANVVGHVTSWYSRDFQDYKGWRDRNSTTGAQSNLQFTPNKAYAPFTYRIFWGELELQSYRISKIHRTSKDSKQIERRTKYRVQRSLEARYESSDGSISEDADCSD